MSLVFLIPFYLLSPLFCKLTSVREEQLFQLGCLLTDLRLTARGGCVNIYKRHIPASQPAKDIHTGASAERQIQMMFGTPLRVSPVYYWRLCGDSLSKIYFIDRASLWRSLRLMCKHQKKNGNLLGLIYQNWDTCQAVGQSNQSSFIFLSLGPTAHFDHR